MLLMARKKDKAMLTTGRGALSALVMADAFADLIRLATDSVGRSRPIEAESPSAFARRDHNRLT